MSLSISARLTMPLPLTSNTVHNPLSSAVRALLLSRSLKSFSAATSCWLVEAILVLPANVAALDALGGDSSLFAFWCLANCETDH